MTKTNLVDYDNWYVIQTATGNEFQLKNKIDLLFKNKFNMLIPLREMLHSKNGDLVKTTYPLFPGYIFLHNDINSFIYEEINIKISGFIKPVCFNDKPAKIRPEEIQYLDTITNEHGVVPLSKAIFHKGDDIEILSGPLKNFKGTIIFINKKKHKAKVRVKLFNREIDTILGLNIIKEK